MAKKPKEKHERRALFLRDLSRLTVRYGVGIAACGCCGSPWLTEESAERGQYETNEKAERLSFVSHD